MCCTLYLLSLPLIPHNITFLRVIAISGSLIWSKTLMKLIFNPCGEFRWRPKGPVSQILSRQSKNAVVIERVGEGRIMLELIKESKRNWLDHWLRRNCRLKDVLEGMVNGKKVRSRRNQMIDDIMINGLYEDTKRKAEKRVEWRMLSLQWKTCPWAEHYDWLIDSLLIKYVFRGRGLIYFLHKFRFAHY